MLDACSLLLMQSVFILSLPHQPAFVADATCLRSFVPYPRFLTLLVEY